MLRLFAYVFSFFLLIIKFNFLPAQIITIVDTITIDKHLKFLSKKYKYHKGDNMKWASYDYDDSSWNSLSSSFVLNDSIKKIFNGIGWFRIHFTIDSNLFNKTIAFNINQEGASEIYLNGKLIAKFGKVANNIKDEEVYTPRFPVPVKLSNKQEQVLAIRYSNFHALENYYLYKNRYIGFYFFFDNLVNRIKKIKRDILLNIFFTFLITFYLTLSLLHFFLYLFYRKHKSNLYYSILMFFFALPWLSSILNENLTNPFFIILFNFYTVPFLPFLFPALLAMIYNFFYSRFSKFFWIIITLTIAISFTYFFYFKKYIFYLTILLIAIVSFDIIRITYKAIKEKKQGAWIIGTGTLIFTGTIIILIILFITSLIIGDINITSSNFFGFVFIFLILISLISIPISMTIYLASDFARKNKKLEEQLIQVKKLSEENLKKEKEKQELISKQKEKLEIEVIERTKEIVQQKNKLEAQNKVIFDSIRYSKRIQEASLPSQEYLSKIMPSYFLLFKPKDIIGGDFYWSFADENSLIFTVGDATGHGVPGAIVSMLGISLLNQIVIEKNIRNAGKILTELKKATIKSFKQTGSFDEIKEGYDMALVLMNYNKQKDKIELNVAAGFNSVYIVTKYVDHWKKEAEGRENIIKIHNYKNLALIEIRAERMPVGTYYKYEHTPFTNHKIFAHKDDIIYLFSDGYADQFGGPKGKKYSKGKFKELLVTIYDKPMKEQKEYLEKELNNWLGDKYEQLDDITVMGVKL